MSFVVESDLLLREIRLARGFINTRSRRPDLRCIRLAVQDGVAQITATDVEVSLTRRFPVQQQAEPFVAVIPFSLLSGIAMECPGLLTIQSGQIGREPAAIIKHKTAGDGQIESRFLLQPPPTSGFPAAEKLDGDPVIRLRAADLIEALRWTTPALDDDLRYGLVFRQDQGHITVAATNGQVLAAYGQVPAELPRLTGKPMVIPWKVADRLLGILEREATPEAVLEIRVRESESYLPDAWCFSGDGWHMNAAVQKAEFPARAWELFQREDTSYGTARVEAFRQAFKQVAAAVKADDQPTITITFTDKGLVLSGGQARCPVGGACRGIAQDIRVPVKHLRDWLKVLPKEDWIGLAAVSISEPAVFLCRSKPQARWMVAGYREAKNNTAAAATAA